VLSGLHQNKSKKDFGCPQRTKSIETPEFVEKNRENRMWTTDLPPKSMGKKY